MSSLGTAYVLPSTVETATFNSGDIALDSQTDALALYLNISAISGAGAQAVVTIDAKMPDGNYFNCFTSAALSAVAKTIAYIGPALPVNVLIAPEIRVSVAISGTTPSISLSITLEAHDNS
jgi:hypothetical protein